MKKRPKTRNLSLLCTRKLGIKNFIFIPKHRFASETFSYKYRDEMKIIPVLDNHRSESFFELNPIGREQSEHEGEQESEGEASNYQLRACDI